MNHTAKPQYSQELLLRLISETKNKKDLVQLSALYVDLEEFGDIIITRNIAYRLNTRYNYFHRKETNLRQFNNIPRNSIFDKCQNCGAVWNVQTTISALGCPCCGTVKDF